jgi:hypothetical protein
MIAENNDYQRFLKQIESLKHLNTIDQKSLITPQSEIKSAQVVSTLMKLPVDHNKIKASSSGYKAFKQMLSKVVQNNQYVANSSIPSIDPERVAQFTGINSNEGDLADPNQRLFISNNDEIDYISELQTKLYEIISDTTLVDKLVQFFDTLSPEYVKEMTNNFDYYVRIIKTIPQPVNYQRLTDVLKSKIEEEFNKRGVLSTIQQKANATVNATANPATEKLYNMLFKKNASKTMNSSFENTDFIKTLFKNYSQKRNMLVSEMRNLFTSNDPNDIDFLNKLASIYDVPNGPLDNPNFTTQTINSFQQLVANKGVPQPKIDQFIENIYRNNYKAIVNTFPIAIPDNFINNYNQSTLSSVILHTIANDNNLVNNSITTFLQKNNQGLTSGIKGQVTQKRINAEFNSLANILDSLDSLDPLFDFIFENAVGVSVMDFKDDLSNQKISKQNLLAIASAFTQALQSFVQSNAGHPEVITAQGIDTDIRKILSNIGTLDPNLLPNASTLPISYFTPVLPAPAPVPVPAPPAPAPAPVPAPVAPAGTPPATQPLSPPLSPVPILMDEPSAVAYISQLKKLLGELNASTLYTVMGKFAKKDDCIAVINAMKLNELIQLYDRIDDGVTNSSITLTPPEQVKFELVKVHADSLLNQDRNNISTVYGLGLKSNQKPKKVNKNHHVINNKYYVDKSLLDKSVYELRYLKNKHLKNKPITLTNNC